MQTCFTAGFCGLAGVAHTTETMQRIKQLHTGFLACKCSLKQLPPEAGNAFQVYSRLIKWLHSETSALNRVSESDGCVCVLMGT